MSTVIPQVSADPRWLEAERLFQAQQHDAAADLYRQLGNDPQLAPVAHLRLSMLASLRGRYREAVAAALAAFEARVAEPELIKGIARRLKQLGEVRAMYACAHDLSVLRGRNPGALFELGRMLVGAGFQGDGLQLLERARNAGLRGPKVAYLIGQCQQALGRPDVAAREFEAALRTTVAGQGPVLAPVLLALASLPASVAVDADALAARLGDAIDRLDDDDPQLPMVLYALFAMLDRAGKPDAAWPALERGMRLRRRLLEHDPAAGQALFDHLGTLRPQAATGAGAAGPRPVFVVGPTGAGIELLANLLGAHPDITDAGALRDLVFQLRWCCDQAGGPVLDLALAQGAEGIDFAELGRRYLAHTQWRATGKAVFLDRTPANFAAVSYIARALPQARILHVVRGPMDTCFSNLAQWSPVGEPWSHDQVEMADHYRNYRTLMAQARMQYPGLILDVRHDELVADPEAVLREVLGFCELPWHDDLRAPAPTDAAHQWRRYESQLAPLKQRLGALAY